METKAYGLRAAVEEFFKKNEIKYYKAKEYEEIIALTFLSGYKPYEYPEDCYKIDAYYTVSNRSYRCEKELMALLAEYGIGSEIHKAHDLRSLAEESMLGNRALSGFLYNDDYGTFCFIGCIDVKKDDKPSLELLNEIIGLSSLPTISRVCSSCGKCVSACPVGAVPDKKEQCLRNIQENARKELTEKQLQNAKKLGSKLLGCDICQRICPINEGIEPIAPPKDAVQILHKESIKKAVTNNELSELKEIIGTNYARKSVLSAILELLSNNEK